jgi:hypothetical protein
MAERAPRFLLLSGRKAARQKILEGLHAHGVLFFQDLLAP